MEGIPRQFTFQGVSSNHDLNIDKRYKAVDANTSQTNSFLPLQRRDIPPQPKEDATIKNQPLELDNEIALPDYDPESTNFHRASQRGSIASMTSYQPEAEYHQSSPSEGDLIEVQQGAYQLPLDPKGKGKLKNKYVMPDGTVVNGKGLGRGRPGIKRGARKSALSNEFADSNRDSYITNSTSPSISQDRSVSVKRKRADSDAIDDEYDDDGLDGNSRDSTPEYNPIASTQTRSGRQSQKPAPMTNTPLIATPTTKRPLLTPSQSSPSIKKHPKIKAKVYRGREQFALCEHCLRGNGPPANVIVFCDACNKCWHQRCHEPKITKEVVADTKAEWFCVDCDRILHGKKKNKPGPKPAIQVQQPVMKAPPPVDNQTPRYGLPLIPGMNLSPVQRKDYLNSLAKDKLIEIVLYAANLAPNMPIFETPYHLLPPNHPSSQPQSQTAAQSTQPSLVATAPQSANADSRSRLVSPTNIPIYDHPTAAVASKTNTQLHPPATAREEDEGYYDDFDEMALLYPKPGEGVYDLTLMPEGSDLGIMLESSGCTTFSHWVRGQGEWRRAVEGGR